MQIAIVATARKLACLCWTMIERGEDYAFARPSLTDKKLRALELRAGMPARRGHERHRRRYSLKEVRQRELELAEQAEHAYRQQVADWQANGPAAEVGRGRRQWDATEKALCGASCAAGISPRTCASLGGRPRPRASLTPADTRPQTTPRRDEDAARPNASEARPVPRFRRHPAGERPLAQDTRLRHKHTAERPERSGFERAR